MANSMLISPTAREGPLQDGHRLHLLGLHEALLVLAEAEVHLVVGGLHGGTESHLLDAGAGGSLAADGGAGPGAAERDGHLSRR